MLSGCRHVGEEVLERYAMGTASEGEAESLEEHLLICDACQERLTQTDDYVRTMRAAASALRAERPSSWRDSWEQVRIALARPTVAWAAAAGVLLLILLPVLWQNPHPTALQPVAIVLQAVREASPTAAPLAPGNRALTLQLDLSGLPSLDRCEHEIVTGQGSRVMRSKVTSGTGCSAISLQKGLQAGQYWVRLYGSTDPTAPLREYSLRVE